MTRLALLLVVCGLHAQADLPARLERVIAERAADRGFMGAVLVAKDGKVVLEKGVGMANNSPPLPSFSSLKQANCLLMSR